MAERDQLDEKLHVYVDICAALYRKIKEQLGPPTRERVAFWVPDVDSDFASGRVNWSVREKEVVDWDAYSFPVHKAFEESQGVDELIEEIARLADVYVGRVRFVLSSLALRTGIRAERGSRKRLVSEVRAVVTRDIKHDPGPSVTRAYIVGGSVAGRRKLDGRTWLRPPRSSDFPIVVFDRFNPGATFDKIRPHSILEARYGEGEAPQGDETRRWLTALRLATGHPMVIPESHHLPVGPTAFGMGSTMSSPHAPTNYPPAEIPKRAIDHARKIEAVIVANPPPSFVEAAIDRLGRSIEEPSSVPQRLLYAVMGFEALLLSEDDRGPKRVLADRVGIFLGLRPGTGQALRDRIHRAYRLRSRYVHGHDLRPQDVQQLGKLYPALRGDLCKAIVAAIVYVLPKTRLLKQLDDALVDPALAVQYQKGLHEKFRRAGLGGLLAEWSHVT